MLLCLVFSVSPEIVARIDMYSWFMAGISNKKIRIIMKLSIITSVEGVEPRNRAAKINEKIIMYIIATEESNTV